MEQNEFLQRLTLITDLIEESNKLKKGIISEINNLPTNINILLPSLTTRDENFLSYLNLLQNFQFSDNLTSPSDLFPGIRTAADTADPEELSKKASEMKMLASSIDILQKKAGLINSTVIQNLKRCLSEICEYIQQENQIYDLAIELLQDADSIYDIGQIAKNT